jgi:hypothetical protein
MWKSIQKDIVKTMHIYTSNEHTRNTHKNRIVTHPYRLTNIKSRTLILRSETINPT